MLLMAAAVFVGLSAGCVSYGGLPKSDVRVEAVNSPQIELRRPDALVTPQGTRIHGWACRRSRATVSGSSIRVERIGKEGDAIAVADGPLDTRRLAHHRVGCVVYDVKTAWRLQKDETLRVSVRWR
jgi:hypothetical protein